MNQNLGHISGNHVWYCNVGQKFSYVAKNWIGGNYTENAKYMPKTDSINKFQFLLVKLRGIH